MSDEMENVPRRLRRFQRKGTPIPEEMKKWEKPETKKEEESSSYPKEEPWMSPSGKKSIHVHEQRNRERKTPPFIPPFRSGGFEKVMENTQKPALSHIDKALGLHEKAAFEDRLPASGEDSIEHGVKNEKIEQALKELKDLASIGRKEKQSQPPASFHFTPAGGAPTPPHPIEKITAEAENIEKVPQHLSPRERVEWRRQRGGDAPENNPSLEEKKTGMADKKENEDIPAHIRRRMGKVENNTEDEMEKSPSSHSTTTLPEEETDFKDLFGEEKSVKKKKKPFEEDDDLSLGDDFPIFEEDK
ncbi:MAG: hypothetical protein V1776_04615 [Candidatus Diapherotrites archaeon]